MYSLLDQRATKPVLTMTPAMPWGDKVTFICSSHSNVEITGYTWYLPFWETPYMMASSIATIPDVSNMYVGKYSCAANINGVDSEVSNVLEIIVGKLILKIAIFGRLVLLVD